MHNHKMLNLDIVPEEKNIIAMSELLKVTSDLTRLRILFTLLDGEKNVCCIQEMTGKSQSLISHQLKKLKDANLVKSRNESKKVYYALSDEHVKTLLEVVYSHILEKVGE